MNKMNKIFDTIFYSIWYSCLPLSPCLALFVYWMISVPFLCAFMLSVPSFGKKKGIKHFKKLSLFQSEIQI